MTKRILALAMVLLLALGLCACGGTTPEKEIDNSEWEISGEFGEYSFLTHWEFKGGRMSIENILNGTSSGIDEGTFVINEDGTISLTWDDPDSGRVKTLYYTFEDNTLQLYTGEELDNPLERVK